MKASLATALICALALTVLSSKAFADPPGQMKMQYMISPPMVADGINCSVLNLSDREIEVEFRVRDQLPVSFLPPTLVSPGSTTALLAGAPNSRGFCIVRWFGKPGELLGSACAELTYNSVIETLGYGCLELRKFDYDSDQD